MFLFIIDGKEYEMQSPVNSNTSYVLIYLSQIINMIVWLWNSNTSYVLIYPSEGGRRAKSLKNSNTSYVLIYPIYPEYTGCRFV